MNVAIPGPSQLQVRWGCRRCGFTGGLARSKLPVTVEWTEDMVRPLLVRLRVKLVGKHYAQQACLAGVDDFTIERYVPPPDERLGGIV
jgi:hypothetical protein